MIPEPHRSYVLELLLELDSAADGFVLVGAQAMKFLVDGARATKDFDFLLDAVSLRGEQTRISQKLMHLGYRVIESARNFQFQKSIPGSNEIMRVEFMAPEELKRKGSDFRVEVQEGSMHGRAEVEP